MKTARRKKPPVVVRIPGNPDAPPAWDHQRLMTRAIVEKRRVMLHADMRTGKTRATIDALEALDVRRALIVGPKVTVPVWEDQFAMWARERWELRLLDERGGSCKSKAQHVLGATGTIPGTGRVAVVVNYESAWRASLAEAIEAFDPEAVILDESQKIAAPAGRASLWASRLCKPGHRVIAGLTGTPGEPHQLYAQFRAIVPGALGTNFREYVTRYVQVAKRKVRVPDKRGGGFREVEVDTYVGGKNVEELARRMAPHTVRVTRDVLRLVPASHQTIRFDLSPEGRRAYAEMEEDLRARVAGGEVTAKNGMVALLRLQQITGGSVPTDDGDPVRVDRSKMDALEELLAQSEPDEPVVVVARFTADLDAIHEVARSLERGSLELSGRRNQLAAWKDGRAPVLAVQIQAGGIGIDLTRAAWCVFYSVGFSLNDFEQCVARIHGPDQTADRVDYFYLVARDTVDEPTYGALRRKKRVVDAVVDGYLRQQAG